MGNYEKVMSEAESYAKMAVNSFGKKKFDNKFLVSLVTMSLEKFMVAYLMSKDNLPNGHTLSFLVQEMTKYTSLPVSYIDQIEKLDDKIQLCSLDVAPPFIPTDEEMSSILKTLSFFQELITEEFAIED